MKDIGYTFEWEVRSEMSLPENILRKRFPCNK